MNSLLLLLPALVTANKCAARKNKKGQVMSPVTMGVDPTQAKEPPKCVSVNTGACAGYVIFYTDPLPSILLNLSTNATEQMFS